jgi:hypothetical protein
VTDDQLHVLAERIARTVDPTAGACAISEVYDELRSALNPPDGCVRLPDGTDEPATDEVMAALGYIPSLRDLGRWIKPHPYVTQVLRRACGEDDDRPEQLQKAVDLLDKWSRKNADFDARVSPQIESHLKEHSPRHFPAAEADRAAKGGE